MAVVVRYAPDVFNSLNGVFCVHKPEGSSVRKLLRGIRTKLAQELNSMECRPPRKLVKFHEENIGTTQPVVTTVTDLADHPLVVGDRYKDDYFSLTSVDNLSHYASGIQLLCIGHGSNWLRRIQAARHVRVYHLKGKFGVATDDFYHTGQVLEKSTYHHIKHSKLDKTLAAIQAGNQKAMFTASGIDLQTQEAYDLAVKGLMRPKQIGKELGTVVYGIKCINFDPPNFTLEVHCINENSTYLMRVIHLLGLIMKSNATCTQVRRIRYGNFLPEHALVRQMLDSQNITENIEVCKNILRSQELLHEPGFSRTD